jgi:hypothetical protein
MFLEYFLAKINLINDGQGLIFSVDFSLSFLSEGELRTSVVCGSF